MVDAEKPGSDNATALQALDLTFSIDLCIEEGGGSIELINNGKILETDILNTPIDYRKGHRGYKREHLPICEEVCRVQDDHCSGESS